MITKIKLLAQCETRRADKQSNGYYIVESIEGKRVWNTCFHRWAHKIWDRIEIRKNSMPTYWHTYSRIPATLKPYIFFVYVNARKEDGFIMNLPEKSIIVGSYDPQVSGEYLNYAYLVYCPTEEAPSIQSALDSQVWLRYMENEPVLYHRDMVCPERRELKLIKFAEPKEEVEELEFEALEYEEKPRTKKR